MVTGFFFFEITFNQKQVYLFEMRQAVLTCYDISGVEMQLREVQASVLGQN